MQTKPLPELPHASTLSNWAVRQTIVRQTIDRQTMGSQTDNGKSDRQSTYRL